MTTKRMNFDKGISKNEGLISSSLILIQGPNSGASGLDFRANARGEGCFKQPMHRCRTIEI